MTRYRPFENASVAKVAKTPRKEESARAGRPRQGDRSRAFEPTLVRELPAWADSPMPGETDCGVQRGGIVKPWERVYVWAMATPKITVLPDAAAIAKAAADHVVD